MVNGTGPVDPADTGKDVLGNACASGYCHIDYYPSGAGIVNAAAAVG